ncbi:MAG: DUF5677 domain-containing protein [Rhizobiaceae bacterium]
MDVPKSLIGLASHFIGECFDCGKPLLDNEVKQTPPVTRFITAQLYIDNVLTGESILILLEQGNFWDAEILLRTVVEGSLKFIYILEDQDCAEKRAKEFFHVLTGYSSIKRSNRLESMTNKIEFLEKDSKILNEIIISRDEQELFRKDTNKADRKSLENKWSFHGLLQHFSKSEDERYRLFEHLSYQYGMASHLTHKDGDAMGLVWERSQRSAEERKAVNTSQTARIISDLCQLSKWRLHFLFKSQSHSLEPIEKLNDKYKALFDDLKDLNNFNPDDFT